MRDPQNKSEKIYRRLFYHLYSWKNTLGGRWRNINLNLMPGVVVSKDACVENYVDFSLMPVGIRAGGQISVGSGCKLSRGSVLAPWGGNIVLQENVFIGPYTVLYGQGGLVVRKNTLIAGHTFIVASNHKFSDADKSIWDQGNTNMGVDIGEDVWIGCGVRILDGVSIGKGCVIGAGSVVNKSLPEYSVAVGIPATVVKLRSSSIN